MTKQRAADQTYHVPPCNHGQGVEVAYAIGEEGIYRRITDRSAPANSTDRVTYSWAAWGSFPDGGTSVGDDPWNAEPMVPEDLWKEVTK